MTNYAPTGPWNNGALPSISATFLDNVESFLQLLTSSAAQDVNVTSNGAGLLTITGLTVSGAVTLNGVGTGLTVAHNATVTGNLTTAKVNFTTGSITRMAWFGPYTVTNSLTTFYNHNLGVIPDFILPVIAQLTNTLHIVTYDVPTMTTTQVKLTADTSVSVQGLAFKF